MYDELRLPRRRSSTPGIAPVSPDDLARRAAHLWSIDPRVPPARRSELLGDLQVLDTDLDALLVRLR